MAINQIRPITAVGWIIPPKYPVNGTELVREEKTAGLGIICMWLEKLFFHISAGLG